MHHQLLIPCSVFMFLVFFLHKCIFIYSFFFLSLLYLLLNRRSILFRDKTNSSLFLIRFLFPELNLIDIDLDTINYQGKVVRLYFSALKYPPCHMINSRFDFIGYQGGYNYTNDFIRSFCPNMGQFRLVLHISLVICFIYTR